MVIVEGKIKGKDRPRFFKGHTYTPKASKDYEKIVKDKIYQPRRKTPRNGCKSEYNSVA